MTPEDYFDGLLEEDKPVIAFTKVSGPYGWLGNMSPHQIIYNGETYKTAEALFQAMRFSDKEIIDEIRLQKSPMTAKAVAKQNTYYMSIQPLSDVDIENMKTVVRLKIEQHPNLKKELIDTGVAIIIEDCTYRQQGAGLFWGSAKKYNSWIGQNVLGNIWMDLREKININRC